MKEDSTNQVTAKFGNEGDRIMAGKPCDNCNCGKKELFDAMNDEDKKKLETG